MPKIATIIMAQDRVVIAVPSPRCGLGGVRVVKDAPQQKGS